VDILDLTSHCLGVSTDARPSVAMEHPKASDDEFAAKLLEVGEELYVAARNIVEQQSAVIEAVTEQFMRAKRAARNPQVFELEKRIVDELPAVKSAFSTK